MSNNNVNDAQEQFPKAGDTVLLVPQHVPKITGVVIEFDPKTRAGTIQPSDDQSENRPVAFVMHEVEKINDRYVLRHLLHYNGNHPKVLFAVDYGTKKQLASADQLKTLWDCLTFVSTAATNSMHQAIGSNLEGIRDGIDCLIKMRAYATLLLAARVLAELSFNALERKHLQKNSGPDDVAAYFVKFARLRVRIANEPLSTLAGYIAADVDTAVAIPTAYAAGRNSIVVRDPEGADLNGWANWTLETIKKHAHTAIMLDAADEVGDFAHCIWQWTADDAFVRINALSEDVQAPIGDISVAREFGLRKFLMSIDSNRYDELLSERGAAEIRAALDEPVGA